MSLSNFRFSNLDSSVIYTLTLNIRLNSVSHVSHYSLIEMHVNHFLIQKSRKKFKN